MKLSLVLHAVDGWSGPTKRAQASTRQLTASMGALSNRTQRSTERLLGFAANTHRAEWAAFGFGRSIRRVADQGFDRFRWAANAAGGAMRGFLVSLGKGALLGASGLAAFGIGSFFSGVIRQAAKFEQFRVALEGTEGSAEKAQKALSWVQDFAKRTPYQIGDVMEAFVTARNYGIDPFTGAMQTLGDAASAMNRSLGDAVEALADARTGEFERLKGFGITASVRGAAVTFSYVDKAGKEASKSVGKSALKIDRAVRDILDIKFGGGMERQALTLIGIWNNLQDVVTNFQLSVASRGFFERVKNSLDRVLKWTDKLAGDGTFDLWATRISDQLTALWDASERFIRDTDWQGVATGMEAIVGVIARIVRGIGNASVAWTVFSNSVARQSAEATLKRGPSVWESMFGGYADRARAANQTLADLEARRVGAGRPQVRRLPGGGVIWPEGATRRELRGNGTSRGGPSRAPGAMVPPAPKREKASLEIILKGDGSKQASVGRISAPDDTRITVTRGRAMGRAA